MSHRQPRAPMSPIVGMFIIVGIIFMAASGPLGLLIFMAGLIVQRARTAGTRQRYREAITKAEAKADAEAMAAGRWMCSS